MFAEINNKRFEITNTALLNMLADFNTIECKKDLDSRRFTLADYNSIYEILKQLVVNKKLDNCFLSKSVKAYIDRFGIGCKEIVKNVNYRLYV